MEMVGVPTIVGDFMIVQGRDTYEGTTRSTMVNGYLVKKVVELCPETCGVYLQGASAMLIVECSFMDIAAMLAAITSRGAAYEQGEDPEGDDGEDEPEQH